MAELAGQPWGIDPDLQLEMLTVQEQVLFEHAESQWLLASDAFPEVQERASNRFTSYLGELAVGDALLDTSPEHQPNEATLLHGIQLASVGDKPSWNMVRTNVATDFAERLFKAGNQTEVELEISNGRLMQNGRELTNIYGNTLQYAILNLETARRSSYELQNVMVSEELHQAELLENYNVAVWSPTPTTMTKEQKEEHGFFTDTESMSIQLLSATGTNVKLETAFVAGKVAPEAPRHDMNALQAIFQEAGMPITPEDGSDTISYLMLIPKQEVPNGVVDLVRRYDDAVGDTFYGEAKPRENYLAYAEFCRQRSKSFDTMVDAVTTELVAQASTLKTPIDAIERLDDLSDKACVDYAIKHADVNLRILGDAALPFVLQAREAYERGDRTAAEQATQKAQAVSTSSSCPWARARANAQDNETGGNESDDGQEKMAKRMMKCPFCPKGRVFDDPCATKLCCPDCGAKVINGKVVSTGDGGSEAREARRKEQERRKIKAEQQEIERTLAEQVDEVFAERTIDETVFAKQSVERVQEMQHAK